MKVTTGKLDLADTKKLCPAKSTIKKTFPRH